MKCTFGLLLVFFSLSAEAGEWPTYKHLGDCVSQSDEGVARLSFFSKELVASTQVDGFVAISVESGNKRESLGAYDATYLMSSDYNEVVVTANNSPLTIPFGRNVEVIDAGGRRSICSLSE